MARGRRVARPSRRWRNRARLRPGCWRGEACVEAGQAFALIGQLLVEGAAQAHVQVIQALGLLAQALAGVAQASAGAFQAQAFAGQTALHVQRQAPLQVVQALHQLAAVRGQQFGGGRGRRRAHVGDEVGDGYIGLMAHGADDGRDAGGHGAGHDFLVEAPEIFQRAAATGQDQCVVTLRIGALQGADDLRGGLAALYGGGDQVQLHLRRAAAEHADDVADHCAGGRGDDADALGMGGQGNSCVRWRTGLRRRAFP